MDVELTPPDITITLDLLKDPYTIWSEEEDLIHIVLSTRLAFELWRKLQEILSKEV